MEINVGTCLKITRKDKITEAICLYVVEPRMCYERGKTYVLLCHDYVGNEIENKFEILYISYFFEKFVGNIEYEYEIISNTHFFTIKELTEIIMDIPGYQTLLGVAYCYGDEYYDSRDEDEQGQQVFIEANGNYFKILIPQQVYTHIPSDAENKDNSYTIPYVYVKKSKTINISDNNCLEYDYHKYNTEIEPEELDESNFSDFVKVAYEGLGFAGEYSKNPLGIILGDVMVYDFYNNDGVVTFGNGIMEKYSSDY